MENYRNYTAEEFAQDAFFQQSVYRPTADSDFFWSSFLERYPEKQPVVTAARTFLQAVEKGQVLPSVEQGARMWQGIERQLQEPESTPEIPESPVRRIGFRWIRAAAVLLMMGFGWWFVTKPGTYDRSIAQKGWSLITGTTLEEKVNDTTSPLSIRLSDGSRVVLQPRSRIRYPKSFDASKRETYLEGEGFFDVARNTRQPFIVYSGKVITQVVGTSFTIRAIPEAKTISVAVRTGKVAVYTRNATEETSRNRLLLTPNQQAIFDIGSGQLTKRLVDEPVLVARAAGTQSFIFNNAPVSQVFRKLEQAYGVTIQYDSTALRHCNLTAPLGNEPLFRKLDIICQTIGATYEVWDTRIVVTGSGCETSNQ